MRTNLPISTEYDGANYYRTDSELERFWLFALAVAGKTAATTSKALSLFLCGAEPGQTPFEYVKYLVEQNDLRHCLELARLGNYTKLERAYRESLSLNLREATIDDLEKIFGVGPKTSRFFLLHSRAEQRIAALDTHILKWLNSMGVKAPKTTPSNKSQYRLLEERFLEFADEYGMRPVDLDYQIWLNKGNFKIDTVSNPI